MLITRSDRSFMALWWWNIDRLLLTSFLILILFGIFQINTTIAFFACSGMVLSAAYSLWLFNRISYGNLKTQYLKDYIDINKREAFIFLPLILGTIVIGLYPNIFLNSMHMSVNMLVEIIRIRKL